MVPAGLARDGGTYLQIAYSRAHGLPVAWESYMGGKLTARIRFSGHTKGSRQRAWRTAVQEDAQGRELARWELVESPSQGRRDSGAGRTLERIPAPGPPRGPARHRRSPGRSADGFAGIRLGQGVGATQPAARRPGAASVGAAAAGVVPGKRPAARARTTAWSATCSKSPKATPPICCGSWPKAIFRRWSAASGTRSCRCSPKRLERPRIATGWRRPPSRPASRRTLCGTSRRRWLAAAETVARASAVAGAWSCCCDWTACRTPLPPPSSGPPEPGVSLTSWRRWPSCSQATPNRSRPSSFSTGRWQDRQTCRGGSVYPAPPLGGRAARRGEVREIARSGGAQTVRLAGAA